MKNLILSIIFSFTVICGFANTNSKSLKTTSKTSFFANLFTCKTDGHEITFETEDGTKAFGWEITSKSETSNYLLVLHDGYGLSDYVKNACIELAQSLPDVTIIALDLFDQKTAASIAEANSLVANTTPERIKNIINGAINYVGNNQQIAVLGWRFGGTWCLKTAILANSNIIGGIMYYAMPEENSTQLNQLNAPILGIFANKDPYVNPKVVEEFSDNMAKADKKLILRQYDADSSFANPSNIAFNKDAAADAYAEVVSFLKLRYK